MKEQTKLLCRQEESKILLDCLNSKKPEFIAIYGRRRVGKTFLVRSVFGKKKNLTFMNTTGTKEGTIKEQMANFINLVSETFLYAGARLSPGKTWRETFQILNDNIKALKSQKPIVLFFDEFPWMVTKNSRLLQTLEYFWNQYWSQDPRIKIIICGSSSGWILKNIINNKKGLHNRVTNTIRLEPFNLQETKYFLKHKGINLNNNLIAEIYMVMGGIPYYLEKIIKGLSVSQLIEKLAFSKKSFLLGEFDNLFASLFEDANTYIEIVRTIAQHRHGILQEDLIKKIPGLSSGGGFIRKLNELENAGFIISFKPYLHKRKGVFYKAIDEYTLFYFHWLEPIKTTLLERSLRKGYWDSFHNSSEWNNWVGYSFEALCYKHLPQIGEALQLSPSAMPSAWQHKSRKNQSGKGAQIDLLFNRRDDTITICEIKYTNKPFVIDKAYYQNLINKGKVFQAVTKTKKQIFYSMISANGLKKTIYSEELISSVVTLGDLFK